MNETVVLQVTATGDDGVERQTTLREESAFAQCVREEIERARSKYKPLATLHEGYAVLLEEVDEFWDMVKLKPSQQKSGEIYNELVQIAAMAQRCAEDVVHKGDYSKLPSLAKEFRASVGI